MNPHRTFVGLGVSPGVIKGKARLINSIEDISLVLPGEIIVTRDATLYIIPALLSSAGAICERGGYTSHLAIMCREYMKPCVVGVMDAMQHFSSGTWLELNGSLGIVQVL